MQSLSIFYLLLLSLQVYETVGFAPLSETRLPSSSSRLFFQDDTANNAIAQEWVDRSVHYYSKVMREERRRNLGQLLNDDSEEYREDFLLLAKKHYFALRKIKDGKLNQAEIIYRKVIDEIRGDGADCDHAKLAVTTLLLALLTQRYGDARKTRAVFLNFFRIAVVEDDGSQCACSAKVLCAYALFEMKQGNKRKSWEIARIAVQKDPSIHPVLNWKQFREVREELDASR